MMIIRRKKITIAILLSAIAGCAKPPPPPPPPPPVVWHAPVDRPTQVRQLADQTDQLQEYVAQLPGVSMQDHQRLAAQIFRTVSRILTLAEGSQPSMDFLNRVSVVDRAQAVLAQPEMTPTRARAAENDALQATLAALSEIAQMHLPDDSQIQPLLDDGQAKLRVMYSVSGPMHDLDADNGLQSMMTLIRHITDDLYDEFGSIQNQPPSTAPTSQSM